MIEFSFAYNVAISPIKNTNENVKIAIPYPPRKLTSEPTKNTTEAVNSHPRLKQNPVADARTCV